MYTYITYTYIYIYTSIYAYIWLYAIICVYYAATAPWVAGFQLTLPGALPDSDGAIGRASRKVFGGARPKQKHREIRVKSPSISSRFTLFIFWGKTRKINPTWLVVPPDPCLGTVAWIVNHPKPWRLIVGGSPTRVKVHGWKTVTGCVKPWDFSDTFR